MARLFEKGRRSHEPSTEPYGRVLLLQVSCYFSHIFNTCPIILLQRLYQALTSALPPQGPPYSSLTHFASLLSGPGNIKLTAGSAEGIDTVTSDSILTKDRKFIDEVHYKGWSVKLGDWVHLSNPDDPSRPIIAQVFRCWISEDEYARRPALTSSYAYISLPSAKKGQLGITASWYYRPEQVRLGFHTFFILSTA